MIKAVIFDMDGLLVDSEPVWQQANKKIYGEVGIKITNELADSMMGVRAHENTQNLYRLHPWEGPTQEENTEKLLDQVVGKFREGVELKPGVHDVLAMCKKWKLPVAIASSSPKRVIDTIVDAVELREHFDHIYSAQFEEYGKPHPAVFQKVAKHLNVPAQHCLVFEDAPSGVLAAKAAKMKCIAVPEAGVKANKFIQTADVVIDSLEEFDQSWLSKL